MTHAAVPSRRSPAAPFLFLKVCLAVALLVALCFGAMVFGEEGSGILEGLPLKQIDSQETGAGPAIDPVFRGTACRGEQDSLAYAFGNHVVPFKLLVAPHSFLPYSLEARYGHATSHRAFVQSLSPALSRLQSFTDPAAPGPDKPLALALLQVARLSPYPALGREFPESALKDSDPDLRLSASACVATKGTPAVLNLDGLPGREDPGVCLRNGSLSDPPVLATVSGDSSLEIVRERAEILLLRDASIPPSEIALRRLIETPVSAPPLQKRVP